MSDVTISAPGMSGNMRSVLWAAFWIALGFMLYLGVPWATDPALVPTIGFAERIGDGMNYLTRELEIFGVPFKEITRALALVIDLPADFLRDLLSKGFEFDWGDEYVELKPLSWIGLLAAMTMASYWIGGRNLGLFGAVVGIYLLVFDLWGPTAETFSTIILAVPLSAGVGLLLGILAHRVPVVKTALRPVLDLMQTMPIFAYMVPIIMLFGFGPAAAIAATMIYAVPPMVRATIVGLERVPTEIVDLGTMVGVTRRTETWRILVPSARPLIMVGVNQVIMNTFNMVIIASMIGAGGIGFEVLDALRKLRIGQGIEAGLAITLLAILLDQLSQRMSKSGYQLTPISKVLWWALVLLVAATTVLGQIIPDVAEYPRDWTVSTQAFWGGIMTWLNVNAYGTLESFKVFLLTNFMFPVRDLLQALPWGLVVAVSTWGAWRLGGVRLAILVFVLEALILLAGLWSLAIMTLYLCGMGVLFAYLLGSFIAVFTFRNARARASVLFAADLLQTLPSFVYLIPIVMLFRVGDFAAVIAIAAYAIAPAMRYTLLGLANVPVPLQEAAAVSGCTKGQQLTKVEFPMAVPELLLGLNQTIMMGLAMVVISALLGTNDLGQETYTALALVDPGRGLVAGFAVSFIAIILDRMLSAAAADYRKKVIA